MVTTSIAATIDSSAQGRDYGAASYRVYVLLVLTAVYTLNFIDRALINVIAQPIIAEFHLSDAQYGFLNGPPFAVFYAFMGIPIAMAADRYNRVAIVALCICIWSVMAALCGFATSFLFLLMARIGVAIGEAGGTPPSNSIIADYFKPRSRAVALSVFASGVTIGGALSNYFGGPIVRNLNGPALQEMFVRWQWDWAANLTDWSQVAGWRVAFVVVGAPGILLGLLLLLTVKEPPRGYSDPPSASPPPRAGFKDTLRELATKPAFWSMAAGASLVALVGYGLVSFQAPLAQRLHGVDPGTFALRVGGPLAIAAALGTFGGGLLIERLSGRMPTAVAIVPAAGMLVSIPLLLYAFAQPTESFYSVARPCWCVGAFLQYSYVGSMYTIGQGVVGQRSRASAIAILLLIVALLGNGLGPQTVGALSDIFMNAELQRSAFANVLSNDLCRSVVEVAKLAVDQQGVCRSAYGEGLRSAMMLTALLLVPSAFCFYWSSRTLKRDMLAL